MHAPPMLGEDPLALFPAAPRTPPLRRAGQGELEHAIEQATGWGRHLGREGDLFLCGLCARFIAERLAHAGFVIALPADVPRPDLG